MTVKQAHFPANNAVRLWHEHVARDSQAGRPCHFSSYISTHFPRSGALCRFQLDTASGTSRSLYGNGGQAIGTVFGGRLFTLS